MEVEYVEHTPIEFYSLILVNVWCHSDLADIIFTLLIFRCDMTKMRGCPNEANGLNSAKHGL